MRLTLRIAAAGASLAVGWALVVRGAVTLDLKVGRRIRPLGPLRIDIAAPPETVFDIIADPYLGGTPRGLASKLRVLERGSDLVLAEHYTKVTANLTATTVETVRFERPHLVSFRLLRGPVPHVLETYELRRDRDGTGFVYRGELGTDFWGLGQWWGDRVASAWEATVEQSLQGIQSEAERRARAGSA